MPPVGASLKRKRISRSAIRPGSQRVARTAVSANFNDAGAFHPLRPGTGRGPGFEQHAFKMRA